VHNCNSSATIDLRFELLDLTPTFKILLYLYHLVAQYFNHCTTTSAGIWTARRNTGILTVKLSSKMWMIWTDWRYRSGFDIGSISRTWGSNGTEESLWWGRWSKSWGNTTL